MKYAVVTFGCRVNQADPLAVEAVLTSAGGESVSADRADVVLVNTCSVTASADQGARQTIRRIHRENPTARLVITGCFASRAGAEVAALPGVALTGVHLGAWGRDLSPCASGLEDLLRALSEEPGGFRVRVSSLEPIDCTPAVLEVMAGAPDRFAAHLHLPLQHASPPILAAMRRPYSAAQYSGLVDEVRRRMPVAAIGSDVIVGFPGETDGDFATLAAYLDSSPLTHLHLFPYSDRPGTAAEALPGNVHGAVVKARAERLRAISRELARRFRASQTGRVRPALTIDDGRVAVTDNYLRVAVPPGHARNEWITAVVPSDLAGHEQPAH